MHDDANRRRVPPAIIPAHLERQIAVAAGCDPRTVRAWLHGREVRGHGLADRIAAAVAAASTETEAKP